MTTITISTNEGQTLNLTKSGKTHIFRRCFTGFERVVYKADDGSYWYRKHNQWNEAKQVGGHLYESCATRFA